MAVGLCLMPSIKTNWMAVRGAGGGMPADKPWIVEQAMPMYTSSSNTSYHTLCWCLRTLVLWARHGLTLVLAWFEKLNWNEFDLFISYAGCLPLTRILGVYSSCAIPRGLYLNVDVLPIVMAIYFRTKRTWFDGKPIIYWWWNSFLFLRMHCELHFRGRGK